MNYGISLVNTFTSGDDWQGTTASFKLEDLHATKEDAERAGRVILGGWTLEQAIEDVRRVCLARSAE